MPRPRRQSSSSAAGAATRAPRPVLLHFHIFKNAGTTLDAALQQAFGSRWAEIEADDRNGALDWNRVFADLAAHPDRCALSSHTARPPAPDHPDFRFRPLFLVRHPLDRLAAIYHFERQQAGPPANEAARVARGGPLRDFLEFALGERTDVPSAVCDAQTSWLARGGAYPAPPTVADLERARAAVAAAPAPGVVERTDDYLVLLEAALAGDFPGLDLAVADRNRNAARPPTLLARLREIRAAVPAKLWRELLRRNRLDLELWRFTSRLARTRLRAMPDAAARLAAFRQRKAAAAPPELPWTGERLVAASRGDFVAEHVHRYAVAAELARGCEVLDIACGEGYGSALLARVAQRVYGVDCDGPTIAHAAAKYRSRNLSFLVGRAEKLPLPDRAVDLVVSFETLEHLDDHGAMLAEIKRVLRPSGRLLISTPDRRAYQEYSGKINPFHVRELDRRDFRRLLDAHFRHSTLACQKSVSGSWVVPLDGEPVAQAEYGGTMAQVTRDQAGVGAPYLLALASDAPVAPLASSLFNSQLELTAAIRNLEEGRREDQAAYQRLEREFTERTAWARTLESDLRDTQQEVLRLQGEGVELTNWAKSLDADLQRAREVIKKRTKQVEKLTKWAKSLEQDLRDAQANFTRLEQEFAERSAWAKSLEAELEHTRALNEERDRTIKERSAWGQALEQELAAVRLEVERVQREHAAATAWGRQLEQEVARTRGEVVRLQEEHATATAWGRSLEASLATSRTDYARLEAEFADRTAWAKSLDAELLLTKADRERVQREAGLLAERLARVTAACRRLQGALPGPAAATEAAVVAQGHRTLMELRCNLAAKEAELRAARTAALESGWRQEAAAAEARRLDQALQEAQVHVDHLLQRTAQLNFAANNIAVAHAEAETARRGTERELVLRVIELNEAQRQLAVHESGLFRRLLRRGRTS